MQSLEPLEEELFIRQGLRNVRGLLAVYAVDFLSLPKVVNFSHWTTRRGIGDRFYASNYRLTGRGRACPAERGRAAGIAPPPPGATTAAGALLPRASAAVGALPGATRGYPGGLLALPSQPRCISGAYRPENRPPGGAGRVGERRVVLGKKPPGIRTDIRSE